MATFGKDLQNTELYTICIGSQRWPLDDSSKRSSINIMNAHKILLIINMSKSHFINSILYSIDSETFLNKSERNIQRVNNKLDDYLKDPMKSKFMIFE